MRKGLSDVSNSKTWLVRVYRGCSTTQLNADYFGIPIKQPGFNGTYPKVLSVAQLSTHFILGCELFLPVGHWESLGFSLG